MSEKLKSCPFCGSNAVIQGRGYESDEYRVYCSKCNSSTVRWSESEEKSIKLWNTRASTEVHGMWICNPDVEKVSLVCSVCGQVMPFVPEYLPEEPPFCNCGAKMDGEWRDAE